jgi:SOS response regulatory protein OraA/RecX
MEKESFVEEMKKALLKHGYSVKVVERILKWYS